MSLSKIAAFVLGALSLIWIGLGVVCLLNAHNHKYYLIDIFNLPIMSTCLLWAVVMFITRQNMAGLISTLGFIVLFAAYSPQAFPQHPSPAPSEHPPLKVLFNNLYIKNQNPTKINDIIAEEVPDIVVLLEVNSRPLPAIIEANESAYPYRHIYGDIVILSRFPITKTVHPKRLNALLTIIKTPHGPMELVVIHLTRPWPFKRGSQHDQVQRLTEFLSPYKQERLMVVGDFNTTPSASLLQDFAQENGLTNAPALWGTWPSKLPAAFRIGIDNGFTGKNWSITNRRVGRDSNSDHRPVIFLVEPGADEASLEITEP